MISVPGTRPTPRVPGLAWNRVRIPAFEVPVLPSRASSEALPPDDRTLLLVEPEEAWGQWGNQWGYQCANGLLMIKGQ
jgi:hypothetical protein